MEKNLIKIDLGSSSMMALPAQISYQERKEHDQKQYFADILYNYL